MSSLDFSRFLMQNLSNCQNLEDLLDFDPPGDTLNLTVKQDHNNFLINDQLHLSSGNLHEKDAHNTSYPNRKQNIQHNGDLSFN
jgi:hypothetical protein